MPLLTNRLLKRWQDHLLAGPTLIRLPWGCLHGSEIICTHGIIQPPTSQNRLIVHLKKIGRALFLIQGEPQKKKRKHGFSFKLTRNDEISINLFQTVVGYLSADDRTALATLCVFYAISKNTSVPPDVLIKCGLLPYRTRRSKTILVTTSLFFVVNPETKKKFSEKKKRML